MKLIRIQEPSLIPKKYIEQLRDKDFDTDRLYLYIGAIKDSVENYLALIIDESNEVKGYLWGLIDVLNMSFHINHVSIDRGLKGARFIQKWLHEKIVDLLKEFNLVKCYWSTSKPKAFERMGYKKSNLVMMEYEVDNGRS